VLGKSFYQLKKETEAILDAEKKKLEAKQDKTQQEIETLVDLNITYKLTGGDQNAWTDVPVLLANDKERYTKAVNSSVTNNQNDMLELKNQNQLLTQHINTFESQGIKPLSVNQELKLKINSLEHQVKEKDGKTTSVLTDNQLLNQEKDSKINSLENKNRTHHASSLSQMQMLETLNHEKTTFEQNKIQSVIEMEQLKASNASLEHLVKSKEDTIISLNGENKHLSTTNQLVTEMMETQKALLQAKTNEMELLRQSMERQLADEKKRVEVLEQEIRAPKQEMVQDQTHVQNTRRLNNDIINPANVESSLWW
jgi:hypothetical protein